VIIFDCDKYTVIIFGL